MNMPTLPRPDKWHREPDHDFFDLPLIIMMLLVIGLVCFSAKSCRAETINVERLADAIYYAEGGANTSHPYGILAHYKTTPPRQACINTINHALRDWNGQGDFISFLGSRYCPIGADNDPTGLNKNWVKNVRRLYNKYIQLKELK